MINFLTILLRAAIHEGQRLRSNLWDIAILFWLPLLIVLSVWWVFSAGQMRHLPIGVIDHDRSELSEQLLGFMKSTPALDLVALYQDDIEAMSAMRQSKVYAIVTIPADFSQRIKSAQATHVIAHINTQFNSFSGIIQRDLNAAVATFSAGVRITQLTKHGATSKQAQATFTPIHIEMASLFNPAADYRQFIATTMIPALIHIMAMIVGAYLMGRELRDQTIGRWLRHVCALPDQNTAPTFLQTIAALNGKLMWPMLAFTFWSVLALWIITHNQPPPALQWWATFLGLWLLLLVSLWLGTIAAVATYSLRMALSITAFLTAPAFAFSGVTFPVIAMTPSAALWAQSLPLTHYLHMQVALLQTQAPVSFFMTTILGFVATVIILLLIAAALTKRAYAQPHRWGKR